MKKITSLLRHVVTPLIFCLFLILGLTAALLSGIVEYYVIKDLFIGNSGMKYNIYIPLIIVIVLEGFKLFLHYVIPAHKRIGDTDKLVLKNITKYILVSFSLICTIVYVSNTLYSPAEVKSTIEDQKTIIEAQYQNELQNKIDDIKLETDKLVNDAEAKLEYARNNLKELKPVYYPKAAYQKYINEKENLKEEVEKAEKDYVDTRDKIYKEQEVKINTLKQSYSQSIDSEINSIVDNTNYITTGDNQYLSSALTFAVSIFGYDNYNRITYYIVVLCISLIISIVLELVISFAQSYLSAQIEVLHKLFGTDETITDEEKAHANRIIKLVVQSFIMLSLYLIFQALLYSMPSSQNLLSAFISYFIAMILTADRFRLSLNIGTPKDNKSNFYNNWVKIKNSCLPIIVQSLLCIIGFIIISKILKINSTEIIPSAISLSIGNASANAIFQTKV